MSLMTRELEPRSNGARAEIERSSSETISLYTPTPTLTFTLTPSTPTPTLTSHLSHPSPYPDPTPRLPSPFPYVASDERLARYHWAEWAGQNTIARQVTRAHNLTYLDVHHATSMRPGGHMPARKSSAGDCGHYCLPGPIDEWVRLLLALWT